MAPFSVVLHRLAVANKLRLAETVAAANRVTLMQMLSGSLATDHVAARHELWGWLVIDGMPVSRVARMFGVDRTTVTYGVRITRPVPHGEAAAILGRLEALGMLRVAEDVAARRGISVDAMLSASRWSAYASARQELWREVRMRGGLRLARVARVFGVETQEPVRIAGGVR